MFNVKKLVIILIIFLVSLLYCNLPAKADLTQNLKNNTDNLILNIIDSPILGRDGLFKDMAKANSQMGDKSGEYQIGVIFMSCALMQVGLMTNQELYKITKKAVHKEEVVFFEGKKKAYFDILAKKEIAQGHPLSVTMTNAFKKGSELFKQSPIGSKLLAGKLP
ncbi:MAG: hypothetical protein WC600_17440 [Desulfobaccales bacterium]